VAEVRTGWYYCWTSNIVRITRDQEAEEVSAKQYHEEKEEKEEEEIHYRTHIERDWLL
jgi:hypothetical protein